MSITQNTIETVKNHLLNGRTKDAGALTRTSFGDPHMDESTLACLVGMIYESEAVDDFDLIQKFLDRFPHSFHIIRVYGADLHARMGRFDKATEEARTYLRLLKEGRGFGRLVHRPILQEGVAFAFFLLTVAYTIAGARTYCMRVLRRALRHELAEVWKDRLQDEIFHQEDQLSQNGVKELDRQWEHFFKDGSGADALRHHAAALHLPALALRVDILARRQNATNAPLPFEKEMFLLVQQDASGELILS